MKLFVTSRGLVAERTPATPSGSPTRRVTLPDSDWDSLVNREDLEGYLEGEVARGTPLEPGPLRDPGLLPPIGTQEVWAAGVTYRRSREARMEEARDAGGGDFYDRVYDATRPELFPKASPRRVVGHGQSVRIRRDSRWNVPEPELTLLVNSRGEVVGSTIGNDVSSRDIEGENPLYLPQAKVYDGSCALGPGLLVHRAPLAKSTEIRLEIVRGAAVAFEGSVRLESLKRTPDELVEFLFRETSFPTGCYLMTGTGIVPPSDFTLVHGDLVRISVDPIGTLENTVE